MTQIQYISLALSCFVCLFNYHWEYLLLFIFHLFSNFYPTKALQIMGQVLIALLLQVTLTSVRLLVWLRPGLHLQVLPVKLGRK